MRAYVVVFSQHLAGYTYAVAPSFCRCEFRHAPSLTCGLRCGHCRIAFAITCYRHIVADAIGGITSLPLALPL